MVYMRKIDIDAWDDKPLDDSDSISDLGTKKHELSVWKVKDDHSNIDEIALALAMTRNETKGFMIVLLNPDEIEKQTGFQIKIEDQAGQSLYLSKNSEHKNFMLYTIDDMRRLAIYIHTIVDNKDLTRVRYYDEQKLTGILRVKFESGELKKDDLEAKGQWKKKYKEYEKEKAGRDKN